MGLLAHDLRNPLSALHSNLGFLKAVLTSNDRDVLEAVEDGVVSCEGLAHIINNIDLIGRSFRERVASDGPGVDVVQLIEEVVAASLHTAKSHGVRIAVSPMPEERPVSRGPREPLERAIANLLRNSVQHSPGGGVVMISGRCEPGSFVVTIADAGSCLPASIGGTAFTAIGQVQAKSVPNGRYSRGLGLYCAGLAAAAAHAEVRSVEAPPGASNAFELVIAARK